MTPNELAESIYNHWRKHESEPTYHYGWEQLGPMERRSWLAVADVHDRAVRGRDAKIEALSSLLGDAIRFIERTQYRVPDEAAKEYARELRKDAGMSILLDPADGPRRDEYTQRETRLMRERDAALTRSESAESALRFILRACDDPSMERDPRLDAVAEVARKALR